MALGPPDGWSTHGGSRPSIWRYGKFEVHFLEERVWMFYTDYLEPLEPGAGRTLDRWIFDGTWEPTFEATRSRLLAHAIPVEAGTRLRARLLRFPGGGEIGFNDRDRSWSWVEVKTGT